MSRYLITLAALLAWTLAPAGTAGAGGFAVGCPEGLGQPPDGTVYVSDNCFRQKSITVEPGDVVRWEPRAMKDPHTVTFDNGLDTSDLSGPFSVRFNRPGTYAYFCVYHGTVDSGMRGTVIVEGRDPNVIDSPAVEVEEAAPGMFGLDEAEVIASPVAEEPDTTPVAAAEEPRAALDLRMNVPAAGLLAILGLVVAVAAYLTGRHGRRPV